MTIRRFEEIEAWQLARRLTQDVYSMANSERFSRDWGLRDQITRASGSVMHNIAEGFDSGTSKEFVRFLAYAQRSCTEVQSQLYVALDQHYISPETFENIYQLTKDTKQKIGGFIKYLKGTQST
ncbi:four helix bundle protein [Desulfoluna limicola]|uniref:Four helix bundle protein n=1 Tax=Desulfoluna limicola TaxID=2810562 RepID=A0ABM7PEV8_9BACT|nr:four helix bundle protein [Desulfoluna limicola]BCS95605.1 four helix bundle protein [Desulfoluna limicola]